MSNRQLFHHRATIVFTANRELTEQDITDIFAMGVAGTGEDVPFFTVEELEEVEPEEPIG